MSVTKHYVTVSRSIDTKTKFTIVLNAKNAEKFSLKLLYIIISFGNINTEVFR